MVADFRQTAYGDMASHFVETSLAELCDPSAGIQTGPFGSQLHQQDYVSIGTPILTVEHLGDNRISHERVPRVSNEDKTRLSKYALRKGDIVFSRVGSVDRRSLVRDAEVGWLFSGRCLRIRPDPRKIDPEYLSYFFGLPSFKEHIRSIAVGATMPSLNTQILSNIVIPYPSDLTQQRGIARILGTLDQKIELNRRTNETLDAVTRALFKSWFVDFDPVRAKAAGRQPFGMDAQTAVLFPGSFEDSALGKIPNGWRATTLGVEAERSGGRVQTGPFGSQLHAADYVLEGTPLIMPKDIANRRASAETIARVSEVDADRLSRHRTEIGDIIYSRRGDVEQHAFIGASEAGWLCGTGCLLLRMGAKWPAPVYVSLTLDGPESRAWVVRHAIGATMPNLNTAILSSVPIIAPSDQILRRFGTLVDPVDSLISAKNAESRTLATIRDALLPKLVSGEIRINDAEKIVGEKV